MLWERAKVIKAFLVLQVLAMAGYLLNVQQILGHIMPDSMEKDKKEKQ